MSVTGICQVCESAEASKTCDQCGASVCSGHYDDERGLCANCARRSGTGESQAD